MASKAPYPESNQPPAYDSASYPPPAGSVYPPTSQPMGYVAQPVQPAVVITATGDCPQCHVGHMVESYSLCGILWLILCFPLGLICFLTMKERKCGHCGYSMTT